VGSNDVQKVNLAEKLSLFDEYWSPQIVGELNGQQVKLAKLKGEFVWHDHEAEDELFLVVKGRLLLKLRDRDVLVEEGELFIVPHGVEHKPVAEREVHVMLFEPASTQHTGNVQTEKTVNAQERI
jgi:mannose-6-phosphate isomerase-like protein (cupin superfamily)